MVAVITGNFDDLGPALSRLGDAVVVRFDGSSLNYWDVLFANNSSVQPYDAILFTSGALVPSSSNNGLLVLRSYVQSRGNVFFNDDALKILELAFPDAANLFGNDANPTFSGFGSNTTVMAQVLEPTLAQAAGNPVTLNLLQGWVVMEGVGAGGNVLARGTAAVCTTPLSGCSPGQLTNVDAPLAAELTPTGHLGMLSYCSVALNLQTTPEGTALVDGILRRVIPRSGAGMSSGGLSSSGGPCTSSARSVCLQSGGSWNAVTCTCVGAGSSSGGASSGGTGCNPTSQEVSACQGVGGVVDLQACTCRPPGSSGSSSGGAAGCDFTIMLFLQLLCPDGVDLQVCDCAARGSSSGGAGSSSSSAGNNGCTNTCQYAGDGECDDGGTGSITSLCALGTDCADCGVRGGSSSSGG